MQSHTHIARFIALNGEAPFAHGTKVLVDMTNGHTKLKPLARDDGSEIPFRVIATASIVSLKSQNFDTVEHRDDFTVIVPFGSRVKHAKWLFATGFFRQKIAAIAQIKELVLRERKAAGLFEPPVNWRPAMAAFTNFCNTDEGEYGDMAFQDFLEMLKQRPE